jgi:hypothetical protein
MRFLSMKSHPVLSPSKYVDMESSPPSLLPSDESSGGSNSDSLYEDEAPRLGPLRKMCRGGPFHREEPPRLAPRKTIFRGGTQGPPPQGPPPQVTPPRRSPSLLETHNDASADEMRNVLRAVGAIDGSGKKKIKGWSARRPKEGHSFTKEAVWKRRLRNIKSSLVPEQVAADVAKSRAEELQRSRNGFIKSVSFDDQSLTHPSAADDFSRKKKASTPEESMPIPFKRVGSSFSDNLRKVTDEDLFSLDTPSYSTSDQTSTTTEDDDTTITSYSRVRIPKMECMTPASCGIMNLEQMRKYDCSPREPAFCGVMDHEQTMNYGCSSGESVVDDLRLVADLLISDATCRTFMTDDAIPQRRGKTESS